MKTENEEGLKTFRDWFDWIICGYRYTKGHHSMFCNGWRFGMDTRRGKLVAGLFQFVTDLPRKPLYWRHRIADKLAWASISLRRGKPARFGYYEDEFGNEAARLADRIGFDLILATALDDADAVSRMNQISEMVGQLADLKGAVSWNDYKLSQVLDSARSTPPASGANREEAK